MIRGYCSRCRKAVGGFRNPAPWQCHRCRNIFCEKCCSSKRRVGWIFKKPVCPDCLIELAQGGSRFPGYATNSSSSSWP